MIHVMKEISQHLRLFVEIVEETSGVKMCLKTQPIHNQITIEDLDEVAIPYRFIPKFEHYSNFSISCKCTNLSELN